MSNRLANKITIITGATSGIGEATARRFIEEGATVVLAGRSEEKGEALAKELGERAATRLIKMVAIHIGTPARPN